LQEPRGHKGGLVGGQKTGGGLEKNYARRKVVREGHVGRIRRKQGFKKASTKIEKKKPTNQTKNPTRQGRKVGKFQGSGYFTWERWFEGKREKRQKNGKKKVGIGEGSRTQGHGLW